MHIDTSREWERDYILTSRIALPGERAAFYRSAARGRFARVRPGVFMAADEWARLEPEERHLARARATALVDERVVFSHLTAALIWGLPLVDLPPAVPHVTVARATGGRSSHSIARFAVGEPEEVVVVDGLPVVGLREALLGIAAIFDPAASVPILDAALGGRALGPGRRPTPPPTREDLLAGAADTMAPRRVEFAVGFADGRSGSPGESLSRLTIHRAGLPAPDLQRPFRDGRGLIGITDFWWPEAELVGEFDGLGKYRRDLSGAGRSPEEIVIDEKRREDRLRALGLGVIRWGWPDARSVLDLRALLQKAGLRVRKSQSRP
jgi:hypothetical protein